jgi:hypothetical protein
MSLAELAARVALSSDADEDKHAEGDSDQSSVSKPAHTEHVVVASTGGDPTEEAGSTDVANVGVGDGLNAQRQDIAEAQTVPEGVNREEAARISADTATHTSGAVTVGMAAHEQSSMTAADAVSEQSPVQTVAAEPTDRGESDEPKLAGQALAVPAAETTQLPEASPVNSVDSDGGVNASTAAQNVAPEGNLNPPRTGEGANA